MEARHESEQMNISGIVVGVLAEHLEALAAVLRDLPGVDVHQRDPASGRIVITQDAAGEAAQIEGLRKIQKLPTVLYAELVYHYVGDGD